jgi:ribosomal protein L7Ae-like RNA K-turn-binding protein
MGNNILNMLGLALRAGRLEIGEEPVGAVCRAKDCRLIIVARDAADNTFRRVRHFADAGQCLWISVPFTKDELGSAVGRTSCAMLALTDIGFAESVVKKLAAVDPEKYTQTAEQLSVKAQRAAQRRKEQQSHEKNVRMGGKKRTGKK